MIIHDKIAEQLPTWRERVTRLVRENGPFKVCDITVEQLYGGIRGVQIQVSDISNVDPNQGIRLRGYTIPELLEALPRPRGSKYPYTGGVYYLLMVDALPNAQQALEVENEWHARSEVPGYVFDVICAMPRETHPMTLFTQAILAMQPDSVFSRRYSAGMIKSDYWSSMLDDSLKLTARLPTIAAYIYNLKYRGGEYLRPRPDLDWAANFAYMIGRGSDKGYQDLCRLFFFLHCDHEGGNVSAHASNLVSSALSDVFLASSAGMDGLAGPLHGLANQECIRWLLGVLENFGRIPNREELERYVKGELEAGKVIPGYGHAVLRVTDPRFTAQLEFARQTMADDELFKLVCLVYEVLPPILEDSGKAKNPSGKNYASNTILCHRYDDVTGNYCR